MSPARHASLTLTVLAGLCSGIFAGCQTPAGSAAEERVAQALDAGDAELDAPDAPLPTPIATCADELEELLAGPYADTCGWDEVYAYCQGNDLTIAEVIAELGILTACTDDHLCCHGTCVRYEDAEAHGC